MKQKKKLSVLSVRSGLNLLHARLFKVIGLDYETVSATPKIKAMTLQSGETDLLQSQPKTTRRSIT